MILQFHFPLLLAAACWGACLGHEAGGGASAMRRRLEEQPLAAYRSACLGLQDMADWMSVVSRITNTLSRSVSSRSAGPSVAVQDDESALSAVHARARRQAPATEAPSCSSLANLRSTAQSYVQLQAELLGLKAVLGGNMFKTGKLKLDQASVQLKVLQDRIRHLDALNRTSSEILRKLKVSSEGLSSQIDAHSSRSLGGLLKDITQGRDFLGFLQDRKDLALRQLQGVLGMRHDLSQAQELLQKGDFFQSIGHVLDRLLVPSARDATQGNDAK